MNNDKSEDTSSFENGDDSSSIAGQYDISVGSWSQVDIHDIARMTIHDDDDNTSSSSFSTWEEVDDMCSPLQVVEPAAEGGTPDVQQTTVKMPGAETNTTTCSKESAPPNTTTAAAAAACLDAMNTTDGSVSNVTTSTAMATSASKVLN